MKTDAQLQQDVIAELKWEPSVDATQIGVEVKNGVVTLAGHVASFAEKWNAERAAQRVAGVGGLAVEMDVALSGANQRYDKDIAQAASNALQWTTYLPSKAVQVMVENGWITLSGTLDWDYQRQTAANAVRYLMGVKGVSNNIDLKPNVSMTAVKADIESALLRRASSDAQMISVEVRGDDVILTGKVHSWLERDLAMNSAWSTPGVKNVQDKMAFAS